MALVADPTAAAAQKGKRCLLKCPRCVSRLHFAVTELASEGGEGDLEWDFPKIRVPYFGVLILRILLFGVLY